MAKPFKVYKTKTGWHLQQRVPPYSVWRWFKTPGEAIDYAYKNWPWWP